MSKGKLSALLVFTLVLVSTQCAALCAVEPCHGDNTAATPIPADDPPCHHHHDAPGRQMPAPHCSHQIVIQADVAQPVVTPVFAPTVLTMGVPGLPVAPFPSLSGVNFLATHAPSPPGLAVLASVVLRI
ncbi:MAG: hypothetical protein M3N93_01325 [Acidobacteriota bacterium]|nr:hypothetical protein [Acidobacteriota bacterium]